jgi:hypothetical protein
MKSMGYANLDHVASAASGKAELRSHIADAQLPNGRVLDAGICTDMGQRFGHDFSNVRVHTGERAAASAHSLGALAYTHGNDIAFAAGRYAPASAGGRRLLAHELAHVVQQHGKAPRVQAKEAERVLGDVSERLADTAVEAIMQGGVATPASGRRIDASAATVSWIDARSPAGTFVDDPAPPAIANMAYLKSRKDYRFANLLHAWCHTPDGIHIGSYGFADDSGLYNGSSFLGIQAVAYSAQRKSSPFNEGGIEGAEFEQLAGSRTVSPGVIGGAVGSAVAKGALLSNRIPYPLKWAGQVGRAAGTAVANQLMNFPPIWTRIRLRIKANGERNCTMLERSTFPCYDMYCDLSRVRSYSALGPEQDAWAATGWDSGNPWGIKRPVITP